MSGGDFHPIKFSQKDSPPKGKIGSEFSQSINSQINNENNINEVNLNITRALNASNATNIANTTNGTNGINNMNSIYSGRIKTVKPDLMKSFDNDNMIDIVEKNMIEKEGIFMNEEELKKDQKIELLERKIENLNIHFEQKIKNYNEQINAFEKQTEEFLKILQKIEIGNNLIQNKPLNKTLNNEVQYSQTIEPIPTSNNVKQSLYLESNNLSKMQKSMFEETNVNEEMKNKKELYNASPQKNCCFTNDSFNNTILQALIIVGIIVGCMVVFYLIFLFIFKLSRPRFIINNKTFPN